MWSRIIEALLGIWLCLSPYVFRHPESNSAWWINDMLAGGGIVVLSLLSFWPSTRKAHLLNLVVACWLIVFAYSQGLGDAPAASQNHLVVGLTLLMFAIIPNHASDPPAIWAGKTPVSER